MKQQLKAMERTWTLQTHQPGFDYWLTTSQWEHPGAGVVRGCSLNSPKAQFLHLELELITPALVLIAPTPGMYVLRLAALPKRPLPRI